MNDMSPRSRHESALQDALVKVVATFSPQLGALDIRPEIQAVARVESTGPYESEVSVLLWKGDNVIDCLVFPAWSYGKPVVLEEVIKTMNSDFQERLSELGTSREPAPDANVVGPDS